MRADATRNRARIVQAARDLMADHGLDAGMDEIAARAGVAVGTVYRHFPAKSDLIAAIVAERVQQMAAALDALQARISAGADARTEIVAFANDVAARMGEDRALKAAAGDLLRPSLSSVEGQARDTLAAVVAAGHRQRALYSDVTAHDLALLFTTMPGEEVTESDRRRWLALALRGILTTPDR
ncbi:helix-turn-helix domain-containing protein [Dactylosporangium sp. NPDC005572]|uniref:TetR/AcrR family transcriptional regulator n=1 Tax=Dactylosporangium sp. NPDC005572 TaxID=3156889 RepID=UPI0033B142EF